MGRGPGKSKFTKSERARLRELAGEAWSAELNEALTELHEEFGKWADDAIGPFELSDKIHKFHDGIYRELYGRYNTLGTETLVSRAVAMGLVAGDALGEELIEKLKPEIEFFRKEIR
jgi:hypothetical protein